MQPTQKWIYCWHTADMSENMSALEKCLRMEGIISKTKLGQITQICIHNCQYNELVFKKFNKIYEKARICHKKYMTKSSIFLTHHDIVIIRHLQKISYWAFYSFNILEKLKIKFSINCYCSSLWNLLWIIIVYFDTCSTLDSLNSLPLNVRNQVYKCKK